VVVPAKEFRRANGGRIGEALIAAMQSLALPRHRYRAVARGDACARG